MRRACGAPDSGAESEERKTKQKFASNRHGRREITYIYVQYNFDIAKQVHSLKSVFSILLFEKNECSRHIVAAAASKYRDGYTTHIAKATCNDDDDDEHNDNGDDVVDEKY